VQLSATYDAGLAICDSFCHFSAGLWLSFVTRFRWLVKTGEQAKWSVQLSAIRNLNGHCGIAPSWLWLRFISCQILINSQHLGRAFMHSFRHKWAQGRTKSALQTPGQCQSGHTVIIGLRCGQDMEYK